MKETQDGMLPVLETKDASIRNEKNVVEQKSIKPELIRFLRNAKSNSTLAECDISGCELDESEVQTVFKTLTRNVSVGSLTLQHVGLSSSAGEHIATCLASNMRLSYLDISHNDLGASGLKSLCKFFKHNETLESINLGYNDILGAQSKYGVDTSGLDCLAVEIRESKTIQTLSLAGNYVTDYGTNLTSFEGLLHAVHKCSSIVHLDLSSNGLGATGAKVLVEVLHSAVHLKHLNLSRNRLRNEGCIHLAHFLAKNETLQVLDLSENELTDRGENDMGLCALAGVLALRFRDIPIQDSNALFESEQLWKVSYCLFLSRDGGSKAFSLTEEDIHNTKVDERLRSKQAKPDSNAALEIPMFAQQDSHKNHNESMIAGNCMLRVLNLQGNIITVDAAVALAKALRRNYSLEHLSVGEIRKKTGPGRSSSRERTWSRDSTMPSSLTTKENDQGFGLLGNWVKKGGAMYIAKAHERVESNRMSNRLIALFKCRQFKRWTDCISKTGHQTPLQHCVNSRSNATLARILSFVNITDPHLFSIRNSFEIAGVAVSREFVNAKDESKQTALHLAVKERDGVVVNMLLQVGCDVNSVDRHGNSPMHIAAGVNHSRRGDLALACLLSEHGASLTLMNRHGELPLDCCPIQHFQDEVIERTCRTDVVVLTTNSQTDSLCSSEIAFALQDLDLEMQSNLSIEIVSVEEYPEAHVREEGEPSWKRKARMGPENTSQGVGVVERIMQYSLAAKKERVASSLDSLKTPQRPSMAFSDYRSVTNFVPGEVIAEDEELWSKVCEASLVVYVASERSVESMRLFRLVGKMYHSKPVSLGIGASAPLASVSLRSKLCCVMLQNDLNSSEETFDLLIENLPTVDLPDVLDKVTGNLNPGLTVENVHEEVKELLKPFISRAVARRNTLRQDRLHYLASMTGLAGNLYILNSLVNSGDPFAMVLTGGCPGLEVSRANALVQNELGKQGLPSWVEDAECGVREQDTILNAIKHASSIVLIGADVEKGVEEAFSSSKANVPMDEKSKSQASTEEGTSFDEQAQERRRREFIQTICSRMERYQVEAQRFQLPIIPVVLSNFNIPWILKSTQTLGSMSLHLQTWEAVRAKQRQERRKRRAKGIQEDSVASWSSIDRAEKTGLCFLGNLEGMSRLIRQHFVIHSVRTRERLAESNVDEDLETLLNQILIAEENPLDGEALDDLREAVGYVFDPIRFAAGLAPGNDVSRPTAGTGDQEGSSSEKNSDEELAHQSTLERTVTERALAVPVPEPTPVSEWILDQKTMFDRIRTELLQYHRKAFSSITKQDESLGITSELLVESKLIEQLDGVSLVKQLAAAQLRIANLEKQLQVQKVQLGKSKAINKDYQKGFERLRKKLVEYETSKMAMYHGFSNPGSKDKHNKRGSSNEVTRRVTIHRTRARRRRITHAEMAEIGAMDADMRRIEKLQESLENGVERVPQRTFSNRSIKRSKSNRYKGVAVPDGDTGGVIIRNTPSKNNYTSPEKKDVNTSKNKNEDTSTPTEYALKREIAEIQTDILRREKALAALTFQRIWRGIKGRRRMNRIRQSRKAQVIQRAWRRYNKRAEAWDV